MLALTIYGLGSGSDDYVVVLAVHLSFPLLSKFFNKNHSKSILVVVYQILFGSAVHTTDISELVCIVNSVSPSRPRNNGVVEINPNYRHAGH